MFKVRIFYFDIIIFVYTNEYYVIVIYYKTHKDKI